MREINTSEITSNIARLCQEINFSLPDDVIDALIHARKNEKSPTGQQILESLLENARIAAEEKIPLCQDTGTAVVFLEIGQDVHICGSDLITAINEGVRRGYSEGYLRKSMVSHPFSERINTNDNTPAVIHTFIVPGDKLKITVLPKGAGSENMTRLGMLTPAQGRQGIIDFVVDAVDKAGGNPCPPIIVGVGIGGTAEKTLLLSKIALLRHVGEPSPDEETVQLEQELLKRINDLGIGPQGLGGRITALAVHVEVFPSHIASLPVAVSLQCHSARHGEIVL